MAERVEVELKKKEIKKNNDGIKNKIPTVKKRIKQKYNKKKFKAALRVKVVAFRQSVSFHENVRSIRDC